MSLAGREVAVVGAGIGGLAVALALALRGASVRVYEQAPALTEVGAGIQVPPNGVAVLEALGLARAVEAVASTPQAVELRDYRHGRLVAQLPLGRASETRFGRPYWQVHRADLLAVLAQGAAAAGVDFHLGTHVERVEEQGADLRLRLADGADGRAEVVVAADGVRSSVRDAHFGAGVRARFAGHVAWRCLVDAGGSLPAPVTRVTMGSGRHLVTYPLRGGRLINVVAVAERAAWTAEGWMAPDDPATLRRAFADWGGPAEEILASVKACFLWGLFDHAPMPRWTAGRLALLGDACHPMLPFLAQGATMALEDAWVLAAELDDADDPAAGLAAYARRRLPRTTQVQRAAGRSGRLYHLGPGMQEAAHLGLRAMSALAPGFFASRFDWLFGADVTRSRP